jgi:galactose-1-phosphate uridylyltransferase
MQYRKAFGRAFFSSYISAIYSNSRVDGKKDLPDSLIVYEDDHVLVFVPKSQRSRGEVHVMAKGAVGNIMEADSAIRESLDKGIHLAIRGLSVLGAEMVVSYEVSKRFDNPDTDQRLFYCLLPRHPQSPGTFSEAQGRWVTGHYPEDYAQAFRAAISSLLEKD